MSSYDAGAYAKIFLRAIKAPLDVSDADMAKLSEADRKLVALRCDLEIQAIDETLRRQCDASRGGVTDSIEVIVSK